VFYLKCLLIYFYEIFAVTWALLISLARWGHPANNRMAARGFAWGILKIWGMKIEVENEEGLYAKQPCVYTCNHQGAMDVPIFGWIYPVGAMVIGKRELLYIPIFNLFFLAAGNLAINRQKRNQAVAHLGVAAEAIKTRKISIWIFPEGTRNTSSEPMLPFKKGAFYMAIQAQVPIIPVVAAPMRPFWDSKNKIMRGGVMRVKVLPPIETRGMDETQITALSNQVRGKMLEAFLSLATGGSARVPAPAVRP
jgi:1-acyl-sn-glycerol-3-phosphate acyltransferase